MEDQVISKSSGARDKFCPGRQAGQVGQVGQKPVVPPFPSAEPVGAVACSEGWDRWDKGRPPLGGLSLLSPHHLDQPCPGPRSRLGARRSLPTEAA